MAVARLLIVFVLCLLCSQEIKGQGSGFVRLFKDGSRNPSNTRGFLEVYYNGQWGTVCSNRASDYGNIPAVVCHQLGYDGGNSESSNNLHTIDTLSPVLTDVSCDSAEYLVILQCKFARADTADCQPAQKVKVKCHSARIWNSPYDGMVQLQGGYYTGEGNVYVYCNGQWGAVCAGSNFNTNKAANTICTQLGYTSATSINYTKDVSNVGRFWYEHISCSAAVSCLSHCASCPNPNSPATCGDYGIVNVTCSHDGTNNDGSHQYTCKPSQPSTKWTKNFAIEWFGVGCGVGGFLVGIIGCLLFCAYICRKRWNESANHRAKSETLLCENMNYQTMQDNTET